MASTSPSDRRWAAGPIAILLLLVTGCSGVADTADSAAPNTSVTIEIVPPDSATQTPDDAASTTIIGDIASTEAPADTGNTADTSTEDTANEIPRGTSTDRSTYTIVAQATADEVVARAAGDANAEPVATLANPTASGAPLVFRAVDGGAASADWVEVHLPIQPNGSTGWVPRSEVSLSNNPYRVEIDRASYTLRVFDLEALLIETPIAVGTGETPTPVGDFYLLELLAPSDPTGAYGPYAFGLSGFSEVLSSFGGADEAIIGIHGTNDPSSLGTDVSHGCVRLENAVIEQLATTLPLGTPVAIT